MNVEVKILFFAKAREIVEKTSDILIIKTPINYKGLFEIIINKYSLEPIEKTIVLSINREFVNTEEIFHIKEGDEIAIIPPLSGG